MTQCTVDTTSNARVVRAPQFLELTPLIDIYEDDEELLRIADLPNVPAKLLTLEVNHCELKIEGRAPSEDRTPGRVYSRAFRLGSTLDGDKIEANLSDGVLQVHLRKSEPYRVRKIHVQGS